MESGNPDYEVSRITGIPSSSADAAEEPVSPSAGRGKYKDPKDKPERSPPLDREELAAMWEAEPLMHSMVTTTLAR